MMRLRVLLGALLLALVPVMPVAAEDQMTTADAPWQTVISAQIEAFRQGDADAAFGYAASGFHTTFPNARTFMLAILGSGYAPIAQSRAESYGPYERVGENIVMQRVTLDGGDQRYFEALYQLIEEDDGWRVLGVQLAKSAAIGV